MLMDQLLKKVKAALADRAEWQIYDAYDPTPFDKRPDWFLTVGISGTEMQSPFLSGEFLYYPLRHLYRSFCWRRRIRMCAPCMTATAGRYSPGCSPQALHYSTSASAVRRNCASSGASP